ncbi:3468_t:CDS:2, partial [Dentiscutata erythropus]
MPIDFGSSKNETELACQLFPQKLNNGYLVYNKLRDLSVSSAKCKKFTHHESKICEECNKLKNNSHFRDAISTTCATEKTFKYTTKLHLQDNRLVQLLGNNKLKALYRDTIENSNESQMWSKLSEYGKKDAFKTDKTFSELVELILQIKEIQERRKSKRELRYSKHLYYFFSLLSDSSQEYSIFHKMLGVEMYIGSTLNIEDTNILTYEDIHLKIKEIQNNNLVASQVRCIVLKILISKIPPVVIALLPTKGADSAITEFNAQTLLIQGSDIQEFIVYENMIYNIHFQAPIYSGKPIIHIQDPKHAKKNSRNAIHSGAQHDTEALKHLFGIARQLMPDFSYYELYKILNQVQHRDNILHSENILDTQEKKFASGYIFDFNTSILEIDIDKLRNWPSNDEINDAIRIVYKNANSFSNLLNIKIFQIQTINQAADELKRISQLDDALNICFEINNDDTSKDLNNELNYEFVQDLLEVNITVVENFIEKTEINYINNNSYSKVLQELDYKYEEKIFRDNGSCDIFLILELQKSYEAFSCLIVL